MAVAGQPIDAMRRGRPNRWSTIRSVATCSLKTMLPRRCQLGQRCSGQVAFGAVTPICTPTSCVTTVQRIRGLIAQRAATTAEAVATTKNSINLSFTAETPPPGTTQTYHGEIHSFGRVHQFHVGGYQVTLAQQGAPNACWMAGLVHVRRK